MKIYMIGIACIMLLMAAGCDDSSSKNDNEQTLLLALTISSPGSIDFECIPGSVDAWNADGPFVYYPGMDKYATTYTSDSDNMIIQGISPSMAIDVYYRENSSLWEFSLVYNGELYDRDTTKVCSFWLTRFGNGRIEGHIKGNLKHSSDTNQIFIDGTFTCAMK